MAGATHGGAETAFVDTCLALHESGLNIEVATRPHSGRVLQLQQAGIRVHQLPFGGALDLYTPFLLRRIIAAFQPQLVQTWMSRAARKVTRWHPRMGIAPYLVLSRLGGYYKLKNFRSTDFFIANTADIRRFLTDQGIAEERSVHIDNFTETGTATGALRRSEFDTPESVPILLALGRLHPSKAFDTLLRALVDVPRAWLWIAGEGPEKKALQRLALQLGIADRVRFTGWREDRAELFSLADACVFPSRYEPFGNVIIQAWAHRIPLVTSTAEGPRQYVTDGKNGLMVAVDDSRALADAIKRLLGDRKLQQKLVEQGYQCYTRSFTRERYVQNYLHFYRQCLQHTPTN
jgi:glycosyltransferase involved in cell wall biosynthesis